MGELLRGRLQSGKGDAAHWLQLFNAAYSRKLQMPVYPGSLNLALEHTFDWFALRYQPHIIWFGREEYRGERDILLLPCELVDFERRKAFLWTPTTAARSRPDPWVVKLVCEIGLRDTYRLQDGDVLAVELPVQDMPPNQSMKPTPIEFASNLASWRNKLRVFVYCALDFI